MDKVWLLFVRVLRPGTIKVISGIRTGTLMTAWKSKLPAQ